jgi:hypothetical protein
MRRSSIGHPLRSSHAPPDASDDALFGDSGGGGGLFDGDIDMESPEPRSRLSGQHETPRQARLSHSEDESSPNTRSKGKRKATRENDGGDNQVEEEIAQGPDDVEMQQEDEDEEVAEPPSQKKPAEKRPRKKRELPVVPCKGS